MKKCYIYTRVSTEIQVDGYSLDAQITELERYAKVKGMEICGRYQDAGKSGKNIKGRPEFQRMLRDIAAGKDQVDSVLVFKLSRFARSATDALNALENLQKHNVDLVCVDEALDTSTAVGKLVFIIISAICEMERENIRIQTMEGRREKARQGKWNGGSAPYGYTINEEDVLEVVEEEREAIELIFKLYVENDWGCGKIAKYLNNTGIVKYNHGDERRLPIWSANMVKNILDSEVYCGKMPYGKRTVKNISGEEKRVFTDNYIMADGRHEAIVSEEIGLAAKRKREDTRRKGRREKAEGGRENLLAGILKCPECGSSMIATKSGKGGWYYYKCKHQTKVRGHVCGYTRHLRQEEMDSQLFEAVMSLIDCGQFAEEVEAKMKVETDTGIIEQEIKRGQKTLDSTKKSKSSLEVEIDSLSADTPHYQRKRQDMQRRLDTLYDKLEEQEELLNILYERRKNVEENRIQKDMVYGFLKDFRLLYEKMTDSERKRFYNLLIERIEIYEEPLKNGQFIKSISFRFPILAAGEEVKWVSWENDAVYGKAKEGDFLRLTMDVTALKITPLRPATYGQIKAYVKEHHGVAVSTGYIAEVKRKCGLEMRDNYNIAKKNAPKKLCTKEKEAYIKEALRYFGMI